MRKKLLLSMALLSSSLGMGEITNSAQIIQKSRLTGEDALHFMQTVFPHVTARGFMDYRFNLADDAFTVGCVGDYSSCLVTITSPGLTGPEAARLRGNRDRLDYTSAQGELRIVCDTNRMGLDYCNILIKDPILR